MSLIDFYVRSFQRLKKLLGFLAVLFLFSESAIAMTIPVSYVAKNGVLDLRAAPMTDKIELNGEWLFYWQQLLGPGDKPTGKPNLINFPSLWNRGYKINGKELPAFGYATYRLTVLLPKKHPELRLSAPDVYCAYKLFVNGKAVAGNGKVSATAEGLNRIGNTKQLILIIKLIRCT